MGNFKLTLCYDGTRYRGWQRQGNTENTIQEKLETLLTRLLEQPVELAGAGRTDAGVHARGQVCSFRADTEIPCDLLLSQLRRYLPEDIGAVSLEPAEPRFHARLSCTGKTYVYRIWNNELPNVFQRRYLLSHPAPLDLDAMHRAAELLCGEHDFTSFCALKHMKKSAVRELRDIQIVQKDEELWLIFTGNGFLYNMVRILVGTMLEVGSGVRDAESMPSLLAGRDRSLAGPAAPAHGLTLWEIFY